jgi:hypothetical protein
MMTRRPGLAGTVPFFQAIVPAFFGRQPGR